MDQALALFQPENFVLNFYALPFLATAIAQIFLGVYVFLHSGKNSLRLSFLILCVSFFAWLMGTVLAYSSSNPETAAYFVNWTYAGVNMISPGLYWYASVWLNRGRQNRPMIAAGYFLGAVLLAVIVFTDWIVYGVHQYYWGYHSRLSLLGGMIFLSYFSGFMGLFFYTLFQGYRDTQSLDLKKQIRLVAFAFGVANLGTSDFLACYGLPVFPLGALSMFCAFCTMGYTIIRYKLFDIETVIHKTIMWFLSAATAIAPFAFIIHFSQSWIKNAAPLPLTLFALALMLGFYAYFRTIQPWLDRIFRNRMVNLSRISNRFASELVHLKSLRDLLQYTARILRKTIFAETLSVYLKKTEGNEIYPAIAKKIRNLPPVALDHPFLVWLEKYEDIVIPDLAESDPEFEGVTDAMRDYASKTRSVVVIPFILGEKLIGVLHLGRKENFKPYSSEEISFLERMKSALTIAFSNTLQFIAMRENLEKWNDELEKKVEERTEQLQNTQAQLVQAEKLATIGTLAGGVAHEINNPLTAVLTNAQILKMTANAEDAESLDLIEQGAKRCQEIIAKLMKYARKPMGPETLGRVDIHKVLETAVAFIRYQLQQESIELVVEKAENLPLIEGNSNELEQVLLNLILNAKDAVKQSGRRGIIRLCTSQKDGVLYFTVEDNGMGISKENLQKIFDPFFTTKELGKGTGLGLAVSYGIIKKHNGDIQVNSEIGKGAAFTVSLPAGNVS